MSQRWSILFGLALVLGVVGWLAFENEHILSAGRPVRLVLAPVDPRSLMQGDYMALNYEVQNEVPGERRREDGFMVVKLDANQVGSFVRTQPERLPLASDEVALRYRVRPGVGWGRWMDRVRIATNAFFFQEGTGERYQNARFGEFRVDENGEPRLVGLLDADFHLLGNNRY